MTVRLLAIVSSPVGFELRRLAEAVGPHLNWLIGYLTCGSKPRRCLSSAGNQTWVY
jgi:hypothetical protein